jgi:hypothetical protein
MKNKFKDNRTVIFLSFFWIYYCGMIHALNNKNMLKFNSQNKAQNGTVICSFNFMAHPEFFPDFNLNIKHEDPFGNLYTNKYKKGQITEKGKDQIRRKAKMIMQNYRSYPTSQYKNLKKEEIITVALRLKRSIDTGLSFQKELYSLNKIKSSNIPSLLKFNLNYFNTSVNNLTNPLDNIFNQIFSKFPRLKNNYTSEDNFLFFIPSEYETKLFPWNLILTKNSCKKSNEVYEEFLNSFTTISIREYLFKNITQAQLAFIKHREYVVIKNIERELYHNLTKDSLTKSWEMLMMLSDFLYFYQNNKSDKTLIDNKNGLNDTILAKYKNYSEILKSNSSQVILKDIKIYDNFFVKNYNEDIIKYKLNGISKYILQAIYSKLTTTNDINSRIKMFNFFMHNSNIAAIYKGFISSDYVVKDNNDLSTLRKLDMGSLITINLMKDAEIPDFDTDQEDNAATISMTVQIFLNNVRVANYKLVEFIDKLNNFIADDAFFESVC